MPRKKSAAQNPPAELEPRPSDVPLEPARFLQFSVFRSLKSKPSPDKFPGTLALRRFRAGEVICQQGDAGWTAFIVLTGEDVIALLNERLGRVRTTRDRNEIQNEIRIIQERLAQEADRRERLLRASQAGLSGRTIEVRQPAATVFLPDRTRRTQPRPGLLRRLLRGGGPKPATQAKPGEVYLFDGDLFGELSCLYGTLRSATIVANRDLYVIEMLRNILDILLKDANFQKKLDEDYKARILANHLSRLPVFAELGEQFEPVLESIQDKIDLLRCRDGEVIFDKGDPPDAFYIVRRGLVKVMSNEWPLLTPGDVRDWLKLARDLGPEDPATASARKTLAGKLPAPVREILTRVATGTGVDPREWNKVLEGINTAILKPQLNALKDVTLKPVVTGEAFKEQLAAFPKKEKSWSDQDWRLYNRLLLETSCPGALYSGQRRDGSENILSYCSEGEFLGEIGVMLEQPRSATCVAYVHPRPLGAGEMTADDWREEDRVELVKIPADAFHKLRRQFPAFEARVEQEIQKRLQRSARQKTLAAWDERGPVMQSERFQQLGLIQGQRLMLIDLDRCTRCDECVNACVNTHADGRTRLFLDGNRFGKYLVPTTCRSCQDPVCMIGCPVGSIFRGNNREMVIEDWCIGCQLCARNCPYGSIVMHDIGILPEEAHGWRYVPTSALPASARQKDAWAQPRFSDRRWLEGQAPFCFDQDFQATLALAEKRAAREQSATGDRSLCFRYSFSLDSRVHQLDGAFQVWLNTLDEHAKLWINGRPIELPEYKKRFQEFEYTIAEKSRLLRAGTNVAAVRVMPPVKESAEVLLELAIDPVRSTGAVLTLRAVVCDLCSTLPGQQPACVNACPHDAAMRVDARTNFPVR
jgi:CRP-like cAMP-binding protein